MRLIFVHLGKTEAPHLWLNIRKISQDFPRISITLLLTHEFSQVSNFRNIADIEILNEEKLTKSLDFELSHDLAFRDGFWKYTLLRFQAIAEWHQKSLESQILHVESDVLLLPNFPFDKFENLRKLAWTNVNESHDAPTLVYFPNKFSSEWLAKQISEEMRISNHLTDMTVLYKIRSTYADLIQVLPTVPDRNIIENQDGFTFEGIFDAARIGMWLTGQDPRNHFGSLIRHRSILDSEAEPQNWDFRDDKTGNLYGRHNGESFPIFNLHIHSKRKRFFTTSSQFSITLEVLLSRFRPEIHTFRVTVFFQLLAKYLDNHGIFSRKTVTQVRHILLKILGKA